MKLRYFLTVGLNFFEKGENGGTHFNSTSTQRWQKWELSPIFYLFIFHQAGPRKNHLRKTRKSWNKRRRSTTEQCIE
eukprot:Pgem_evm1s7260